MVIQLFLNFCNLSNYEVATVQSTFITTRDIYNVEKLSFDKIHFIIQTLKARIGIDKTLYLRTLRIKIFSITFSFPSQNMISFLRLKFIILFDS